MRRFPANTATTLAWTLDLDPGGNAYEVRGTKVDRGRKAGSGQTLTPRMNSVHRRPRSATPTYTHPQPSTSEAVTYSHTCTSTTRNALWSRYLQWTTSL
ncbi:hypothetical protein M441DRAFT_271582 [Trichoderma asperellum CBS 433.97]|uniref:Uncharacterized protein n=1 Tax=Trichoderma asperellum (strain ATCC 204424 / CBS 433.97 / NBRC 101777) TaxID=1042311 RepID=A0A2T3YWG3_TRIA4|nr:hypothetical protein M441DRAFT_271582 [Trichoderma asperellum CBS 433.97]PTB36899.1 hypothetical protein M441DRAFT_271582 [Trichoderma asperellum CBS 433.97]